jgi:hypothetical protein
LQVLSNSQEKNQTQGGTHQWNSGAEANNVQDDFEEKVEEKDDDDEPQQKSKHRLQQVADYQSGDCLKEGIQIFILLSGQQNV